MKAQLKFNYIPAPYPTKALVKQLDNAASLLHRYNFALISERDFLVNKAYEIISELSFDISICNLDMESTDEEG